MSSESAVATATDQTDQPNEPIDQPLPHSDVGDGAGQAAPAATSRKGKNVVVLSASQIAQRRDYTKKQNLRRQVYRDLTVFRVFPLQAMAMDDYDIQVKEYFGGNDVDDDGDCSDGPDGVQKRVHSEGSASSSSSDNHQERQQFLQEFLKERSIQLPSAVGEEVQSKEEPGEDSDQNNNISSDNDDKENMLKQPSANAEKSDSEAQSCHSKEQSINEAIEISSDVCKQKIDNHQFLSALWSMEPRIFAMETALKGKRRYISAHLGRFMDHYWRECDIHSRHYYELIKEDSPCRLYFGKWLALYLF